MSPACQGWMKCLRLKKPFVRSLSFALIYTLYVSVFSVSVIKKKFIRYISRYIMRYFINRAKEQQKLSVPPAASGKTKGNSHKIYEKAQALCLQLHDKTMDVFEARRGFIHFYSYFYLRPIINRKTENNNE